MDVNTNRIVLDVDYEPARKAVDAANKDVAEYGPNAERSFNRGNRALDDHVKKLAVLEKLAGSTALAWRAARFGFENVDNAGFDSLLNKVRTLRLALSPTVGTVFGIGAGIAIEQIGKAVAAQAQLIDQESALAAKAKLSFEEVEQVGFAAKRMGVETNAFVDSYGKLAGRLSNSSTRAALKELGVDFDNVTGTTAREAPEVFADIGRAFDDIRDPADKARLAYNLFGDDFEKILPSLNSRLSENARRFKDWGLELDPQARKAVAGLRDEVRDLRDTFGGIGDSIATFGARVRKELVVGVAEAAASVRGLDKDLARARDVGPVGGIVVPINPPSKEDLTREFQKDARALRPQLDRAGTTTAAERALNPQVAAAQAAAEAFDKTDQGLARLLGRLEQQRDLYLSSARAGGILAAASLPLITNTNAQIETINKEIESRKKLEELARDNAVAEKASLDILVKAQATQKYNGEQLLVQRDAEIAQNGRTAKALLNIAAAYDILIGRELKERQLKFDQAGAKDLLESADKRAAVEQSGLEARNRITIDTVKTIGSLQGHTDDVRLQKQLDAVEIAHDAELRSVELIGNKSLSARVQNEQQKASITEKYLRQAQAIEDQQSDRRYAHDLGALEVLHQAGLVSENLYDNEVTAIRLAAAQDRGIKEQSVQAKIDAARQDAAIQSARIIEEHNQSVFDTFKREGDGVLDALLTKSQSIWAAIGNSFKAAILTAVKDVASSRIAASLTELVTGNHVGFERPADNAGPLGKIAAALGLGARPVFGQDPQSKTKLDQPNHLGDVRLVRGAVPVFIANAAGQPGSSFPSNVFNLPWRTGATAALAAGLAFGGGTAKAEPAEFVQSTFFSAGDTSAGPGQLFGGGNIFGSGSILGGPGGTPGFAANVNLPGFSGPPAGPGSGAAGPGGAGGLLSSIGGLLKPGGLSASALGTLGLSGSALGLQGAFKLGQKGGIGGAIGAGALGAFSGLVGAGSLAALFPSVFVPLLASGPIGWIAAAGIGATIGLMGLLRGTSEQKIIDKVKSVYGISVDKKFAKDPLFALIKSNFGGNIDVGIRSPQVRDLLELYAMSTGQPTNGLVPRATASVFANQGGVLSAQSVFTNGSPTSFSGGSALGNGISFGVLSPSKAAAPAPAITVVVQNQLPAEAVGAYMDGKMVATISKNGRVVSVAATDGQKASSSRRESTATTLLPNYVVG